MNEHLKHIGRCNTTVHFLHPVDADAVALHADASMFVVGLLEHLCCFFASDLPLKACNCIYIHAYTVTSI